MKLPIILLATALAASAHADYVIITQNGDSSGSGGQFTAQPVNQNGQAIGASYQTFCIDVNHEFYPGQEYSTTVGQTTYAGSTQPVTIGTAFLYHEFLNGSLPGYFNVNQNNNAGLLQDVIWGLENESYGDSATYVNNSNPYYDDVVSMFGSFGAAQADSNGAYGVEVLQLTDSSGDIAQSQLVQTTTPVPEPNQAVAGGMLCFGGLGVYMVRRKFKMN